MTSKQVAKEIQNFEEATKQTFTVTLKNGETVECRCNPSQTELEAAFQQTLAAETVYRGDIIKPREIRSID